jgi:hypothetical protein
MSQQPPPPPYGGPPQPPYGGPPGPYPQQQPGSGSGMSNKAKFWIGVALTIPALIVGSVITGSGSAAVDAMNGDPAVGATVSSILGLLVLAAYIAMIVFPRTRWVALGILAGTAVLFILAAGACVALIVAYSSSV